jgi:hypothetical protein
VTAIARPLVEIISEIVMIGAWEYEQVCDVLVRAGQDTAGMGTLWVTNSP